MWVYLLIFTISEIETEKNFRFFLTGLKNTYVYVYPHSIFLWKITICSKTKTISEKSVIGFARIFSV